MSTMPPLAAVADERSTHLDRALVAAFLENIPDKVFFKDRASRFIAVSRSIARNFHGATAAQIIGRTDFDFFSPVHARPAYDDEQRIIRTGQPILNKVEKETWPDGHVTWSQTSKMPLRDAGGEIVGTFGLSKDITATREMELELETAHQALVATSRLAGMAEIATGVLHNVGNVLNSLNVSASVIDSSLRQSKAESLAKLAALLREHQADLGGFLVDDVKGRRVPELLDSLTRHARDERDHLAREIASLQKNIDHIKEIVFLQQDYAAMRGVLEPLEATTLMEDSLRMNAGALLRHEVDVAREFQTVPALLGERAKILQILVNLIRNAKYACDETGLPGKLVTLRIAPAATSGRVHLIVADNGVGIPAENLTRIFRHGFTTRAHGHGFGLHSAANAAKEMKGSLTVQSAGSGQGATFTLELPAAL